MNIYNKHLISNNNSVNIIYDGIALRGPTPFFNQFWS